MMSQERFGETFLANPDLFPVRRSGEPWGDGELVLDLPGGPYRFCGLDNPQDDVIRQRMGDLLREPSPSSCAIDTLIVRAAPDDFIDFDKPGWEYSLDVDCQPGSVRLAGLDFMARLEWTPALRGCFWTPVNEKERFWGAFENYFRVLTSYSLLENGGVLIHSAGVVAKGQAYVFMGRSGSGKTTLSRLSIATGHRVLSDDLNAVRMTDRGPVALKLPFAGELGPSSTTLGAYPIRAICRLEKGVEHALRSMTRAEAVASLAACSPNVNHNPYKQDRLLAILESLVQYLPTYVLTFHRDAGFWGLLEERL